MADLAKTMNSAEKRCSQGLFVKLNVDRSVASYTSDTVVGVQILVQCELEHGSPSLSIVT